MACVAVRPRRGVGHVFQRGASADEEAAATVVKLVSTDQALLQPGHPLHPPHGNLGPEFVVLVLSFGLVALAFGLVVLAGVLVVGLVALAFGLVVLVLSFGVVVDQFVYPVSEASEGPFVGVVVVADVIVPLLLEQLLVEGAVCHGV